MRAPGPRIRYDGGENHRLSCGCGLGRAQIEPRAQVAVPVVLGGMADGQI